MNDTTLRAIERASTQGPFTPHPSGNFPGNHFDSDMNVPIIRTPPNTEITVDQEVDTNVAFAPADHDMPDIKDLPATLSDEEKQQLLEQLLSDKRSFEERKRDIELEVDKENLINKRRFGVLGFRMAAGAGIVVAAAIAVLLGMLGYGLYTGKPLIDTGIFSAFLSTISEVIKVIFTAM
jgi:hypothetical protein